MTCNISFYNEENQSPKYFQSVLKPITLGTRKENLKCVTVLTKYINCTVFLTSANRYFPCFNGTKSLYSWQNKTFDFILSQLKPIQTPRLSYFDINIILSNTSTSFSIHVFEDKYFMRRCISVSISSLVPPYCCSMVFYTISENCYCSQAVYTGRVKILRQLRKKNAVQC